MIATIRFLFAILSCLLVFPTSNHAQTRLYVDPAQSWAGYMNVFDLPADGGGYKFGNSWAGADLRATFAGELLMLQANTNVSNPSDAYWVKADGSGNKQMEANWFVDSAALVGQELSFSGNSVDFNLSPGYTVNAFIKVFNADYSTVLQSATVPITAGNQFFNVILNANAAAAAHVQYGFVTVGPNAGVGSPEASGAATFRVAAADPANRLVNPGFEQQLTGWTAYGNGGFTETAADRYYNGGNAAGAANVLVYEGMRVQKVFPQFTGGPNYNGIYQDLPAGPGSAWTASGKFLTHQQDQIGVWEETTSNQAWLEITFRDSADNVLATHTSQILDNSSAVNVWHTMNVTNAEGGLTLIAPEGTTKIRFQEVYHQPSGYAGGSVYADALVLHNVTASDPNITQLPVNATRVVGETASFTVTATGTAPLTYAWKHNDVLLSNGGDITGATSPTLSIANVQKEDAGTYTVTVTSANGSLDASATLTVKTPEEAANLLENPSFESGAFPPWTKFNGGGILAANPELGLLAKDGNYLAQVNNGGEYNGAFQDIPATPGQKFIATGWFFAPSSLPLDENTTAWLEVQFRNGNSALRLYKSDPVTFETPQDVSFELQATHGFAGDFVTPIGDATEIEAPEGTTTLRYQVTMRSLGGGTVYYDAMKLIRPASSVNLTVTLAAANKIDISFPTATGTSYEVVYKDNITDANWTTIGSTVTGDGTVKTVTLDRVGGQRFFAVRTRQ